MTHNGKLGCKMSPNDENEQLSTPSDKFELGKGTPSELCRVFNLSDFCRIDGTCCQVPPSSDVWTLSLRGATFKFHTSSDSQGSYYGKRQYYCD